MRGDRKLEPIKSNSAVYSIYSTAFRSKDQKAVRFTSVMQTTFRGF